MTKDRNALFQFRKDRGLTAEDAGKLFSVNRATYLRWEVEAPKIPVKRLDDAVRITGLSRRDIRPDIFGGA